MNMDRKLTWILLVSLLFNAALIGFLVGNHGRGGPMDMFRRPPPGMMGQRADETTRNVLKSSFDAERENLAKNMQEVAEARRASEVILHEDPLDLEKLDAALARLRAGSNALQESFHHALRDAATKLNAPQRAALGRMLERAPTGRIGNDRRGGGPVSNAIVDIVNGPPRPPGPAPDVAPLPHGMGLGAPAPPPPPGE